MPSLLDLDALMACDVPADAAAVFTPHLSIDLMPHQHAGVDWMIHAEELIGGGVLADVPGMGKTASIMALIDAAPCPTFLTAPAGSLEKVKATVVICTKETHSQWIASFDRWNRAQNRLQVETFGGTKGDHGLSAAQVRAADVILVDYSTMLNEFDHMVDETRVRTTRRGEVRVECSILNQFDFWRVVVDEVQYIDNGGKGASVVRKVATGRRWAVSATPFKNGLESIKTVLSFIVGLPYLEARNWRGIVESYEAEEEGSLEALRAFLQPLVLRRKKDVLSLPQQHPVELFVDPSAAELAAHGLWILRNCVRAFKTEVFEDGSIAEWSPFSVNEMVSMAQNSLIAPTIPITRAAHQKLSVEAARTLRRDRLGLDVGGVFGAYRQNLVSIAGSLCKFAPSRARAARNALNLSELSEQMRADLAQRLHKVSEATRADLLHLPESEFTHLVGMDKEQCLLDAVKLYGLVTSGDSAPVFASALRHFDVIPPARPVVIGETCMVCQDEIEEGDHAIDCPCPEAHPFHKACLGHWRSAGQANSDRCPACRYLIEEPCCFSAMTEQQREREVAQREDTREQRLQDAAARRRGLVTAADVAGRGNVGSSLVESTTLLQTLDRAAAAAGSGAVLETTAKVQKLIDLLEQPDLGIALDEKVIVYTTSQEALPLLQRALLKRPTPIHALVLNGQNAKTAGDRFRNGEPPDGRGDIRTYRVLLIKASLAVSGTGAAGLDLPVATKVILLDQMPADLKRQCADRVHRIGQEKETSVIQISANHSIDGPLKSYFEDDRPNATLRPYIQRAYAETMAHLRALAGMPAAEDPQLDGDPPVGVAPLAPMPQSDEDVEDDEHDEHEGGGSSSGASSSSAGQCLPPQGPLAARSLWDILPSVSDHDVTAAEAALSAAQAKLRAAADATNAAREAYVTEAAEEMRQQLSQPDGAALATFALPTTSKKRRFDELTSRCRELEGALGEEEARVRATRQRLDHRNQCVEQIRDCEERIRNCEAFIRREHAAE